MGDSSVEIKLNPGLEEKKSTGARAYALDALRGFAILTMILSGIIPGTLPDWMYHAQVPPGRGFVPTIAGITWVDLVFPFFLFSMGASMPIAISSRLKKYGYINVLKYLFERGLLLAAFAVFRPMIHPWNLNGKLGNIAFVLGLLAFILLFLMYTRFPDKWGGKVNTVLRAAGWFGAFIFIMFVNYPIIKGDTGSGFFKVWFDILNKKDIIITVLANMAVFGGLAWIVSQNNLLLRISFLGIYLGIRLCSAEQGDNWVKYLYGFPNNWLRSITGDKFHISWLFDMNYVKYLFIVIPGTIFGDHLLKWMKASKNENQTQRWETSRYIVISLLMVAFILVELCGLFLRAVPETSLMSFIMCFLGWYLVKKPFSETEKFIKQIYMWGMYWLILGLFFEPFEGGIKKDHSTLSYYFLTSGLAIFMIIFFTITIDIFKWQKSAALLITNGQNPMIAYVGFSNLVLPVLSLIMIGGVSLNEKLAYNVFTTPWLGFIYGCIKTLLVAIAVHIFTRKKIFWRT